ncbi:MAG: hypothetical protein NC339_02330 [Muribaculaceae bacterium]|nr:hypothetical protein [Muribaculaceae bacterium]
MPLSTPLEQPCATETSRRRLTIGLPKCDDPAERRFPLTPEGAAQLIERGFVVRMEADAASVIHYADLSYQKLGVEVTCRAEALGCDIVLYPATLSEADARRMRRGAMLLTLVESACRNPRTLAELLRRHVITLALDLVEDCRGNTPFADILAEIDGRASVAIASSLLADAVRGKGILLGGVAGIVPCEVLIVGSGIAACAAARSAMGLGATVRMFDNDVYSLRRAWQELGSWVITSSLHPRTLASALRSADVVVATPTAEPFALNADTVATMKKGVLTFDLTPSSDGSAFPSMTPVDLAMASAIESSARLNNRICFTHAGSAVARTAAMALSNTLLTFLSSLASDDTHGSASGLKLPPGIQKGALTFFGKAVHQRVAELLGVRIVDIAIYLSLS